MVTPIHLPQPKAGMFPCYLSLPISPEHCHAHSEHSSVPARDSSASPSPDGQHCSSPRSFPYSLLSQCQGLSWPCTIRAPFIPLCSSSCKCRKCTSGSLSMGQQGDKQTYVLEAGTWRHSKGNGTPMGTWPRILPQARATSWEPQTWPAQLQELSACPAGTTWSVVSLLGCPLQQFAQAPQPQGG